MARVQALRATEPPPRSPEREALAAAIEGHLAAQRHLADLRAALTRANERIHEAYGAVDQLEDDLKAAKANEETRLAAEFMGEVNASQKSAESLAAELDAAKRQHEELERTSTALKGRERATLDGVGWAKMKLDNCIRKVVATDSAIAQLAAQCVAARDVYRDLLRVADFLDGKLSGGHDPAPDDLQRARNVEAPLDLPLLPAWKAALASLELDPDAPLPSL